VFHLFFRRNPFGGGFSIAAGLADATDYLERWGFDEDDLGYLATLEGADGQPLFERGFLDYLAATPLRVSIAAMPEGTVAMPHEPLLRVEGPLLQCQLIETPLLNMINFQTLIATKAARVCRATRGEPVLEFGLRRAQGIDGAMAASRAAHIGGCSATSNVMAGRVLGIPVRGTHAHSWVMAFDTERAAFEGYAEALPNNCVFLVDTYDTVQGVKTAIEVGRDLRERGHEMLGVRLDSGDLAALSIEARRLLDEAGFPNAVVVASNDLDEYAVTELEARGARIGVWGIGTKLVTAYDQPALGGVYKLAAIRESPQSDWEPRLKLSEQPIKVSNPGAQEVRRFEAAGRYVGDVIYQRGGRPGQTLVDIENPERRSELPADAVGRDLLVPILDAGRRVGEQEPLAVLRARAADQLARLPDAVRNLESPAIYPTGLSEGLAALKRRLIALAEAG
jgi:nicotinate phosphoribosyltransferase